jgi:hypothetical protein
LTVSELIPVVSDPLLLHRIATILGHLFASGIVPSLLPEVIVSYNFLLNCLTPLPLHETLKSLGALLSLAGDHIEAFSTGLDLAQLVAILDCPVPDVVSAALVCFGNLCFWGDVYQRQCLEVGFPAAAFGIMEGAPFRLKVDAIAALHPFLASEDPEIVGHVLVDSPFLGLALPVLPEMNDADLIANVRLLARGIQGIAELGGFDELRARFAEMEDTDWMQELDSRLASVDDPEAVEAFLNLVGSFLASDDE